MSTRPRSCTLGERGYARSVMPGKEMGMAVDEGERSVGSAVSV
jgi:hypothetical protein